MFDKTKASLAGLIKTIAQEVWEELLPKSPPPTADPIPSPSAQAATNETTPLTDEQRAFLLTYFDYARKAAIRVAGRLGVDAQVVDDLLETAATDALIAVARRSTAPDYIPGKDKCVLLTAIYRQVRNAMAKFYGWGAERPTGTTLRGLVEFVGGSRFKNPLDAAIEREEEELRSPVVRKAKDMMGEFDDVRRTDGTVSEFEVLKSKLRRFGLSCKGRIEELRDRLADHLRQLLDITPQYADRPRLLAAKSQTDSNTRFVVTWEKSGCVREVAEALGSTTDSVKARASYMRRRGVRLKLMPYGRRMVSRTVSRAVLNMRPCTN